MSIEIIEKPTHKCQNCGCVFSFEKEDLEESLIAGMYGAASIMYLKCPVCGSHGIAFNDWIVNL